MRDRVEAAIAEGRMGERLWLYATYHCNLACAYCLTESAPGILRRRELTPEQMLRAAADGRDLGLRSIGVTGGETFMLSGFPETAARLAEVLPTVVLTNATLFTDRLLDRLAPLASLDCALQISLDSDVPSRNDELRGPRNFAKVIDAIPRLIDRGIEVRLATTVEDQTEEELQRLCSLHRSLGIPDDRHIVRSVVKRGRAAERGLGSELGPADVLPELTVTADGAFLHPFAPTVRGGRTDLDLLVSRQTAPLSAALARFLAVVEEQPAGDDVVRSIR